MGRRGVCQADQAVKKYNWSRGESSGDHWTRSLVAQLKGGEGQENMAMCSGKGKT